MEQAAIEAFSKPVREALFAALDIDPACLEDLGGFESFVFARSDRDSILRITHQGHRTLAEVMGEMHWINHLARHDASVCTPLLQANGELAVVWGDFVVSEFGRAAGRIITESDWNARLFRTWGEAIGRFHRVARQYEVENDAWRRMHWRQDPNFDIASRVFPSETKIIQRAAEHLDVMGSLREDRDVFGIIHCDAHAGNFHYDGDHITFFDFDDTCYCWFGYDVATVLFSAVLQSWVDGSRDAQEKTAREFMAPFLEGYATESDVDGLMLAAFPTFLKVRELSLYAVIRQTMGDDYHDNWYTSKFMAGRRERIENDEPYLEIGGQFT